MKSPFTILLSLIIVPAFAGAVDYKTDVLPIMKEHCWKCHSNEEKVKGNLALDDFDEMRDYQVGKFNIIRPNNPEESKFLEVLKMGKGEDDFMPRDGSALSKSQIAVIEKWIEEGAVIDAENLAEKEKAVMKGEPAKATIDKTQEFLSWTNTDGQKIEARFLKLNGDAVSLLMKDGKSYNYPLNKLNADSQAQAKKLGGGE